MWSDSAEALDGCPDEASQVLQGLLWGMRGQISKGISGGISRGISRGNSEKISRGISGGITEKDSHAQSDPGVRT